MTTPEEAPSRRVEMLVEWIISRMVLVGPESRWTEFPYAADHLGGTWEFFRGLSDEDWRTIYDELAKRKWDVRLKSNGTTTFYHGYPFSNSITINYPGVRP